MVIFGASGDLTKPELYKKILGALYEAEKSRGTLCNAIIYLAIADRFFDTVVEQFAKAKLTDQGEDQDGMRSFNEASTRTKKADVYDDWFPKEPNVGYETLIKADIPGYPSGSDSPTAADKLLARGGDRAWRPVGQLSDRQP